MTLLSEKLSRAHRDVEPGTTGWTVDELDRATVELENPRFEIVNGVLTSMAPARYDGSRPLGLLVKILQKSPIADAGYFSQETDLQIADDLKYLPDVMWLSAADEANQRRKSAVDPGGRIVIPPTLVIESASRGHELHDRKTKFRDYANFRIANYWILDALRRSLECFVLEGTAFKLDAFGRDAEIVKPSLFAPIEIPLGSIWLQ